MSRAYARTDTTAPVLPERSASQRGKRQERQLRDDWIKLEVSRHRHLAKRGIPVAADDHVALVGVIKNHWGPATAEFYARHREMPYVYDSMTPWPIRHEAANLAVHVYALALFAASIGSAWLLHALLSSAWPLLLAPALIFFILTPLGRRIGLRPLSWLLKLFPPQDLEERKAAVAEYEQISRDVDSDSHSGGHV